MQLRVIIVTHQSLSSLKGCVDSVLRARKTMPLDLFVHDNRSGIETRRYLKRSARLNKFSFHCARTNAGKAAALNRSISLDKNSADWTVMLDDDAVLGPETLKRLFRTAAAHPEAAILGCRSIYPDGRIHSAEMFSWFAGFGNGELDHGQRSYTRFCDSVTGVCMAARADVLQKIRFWERLKQPFEDGDFCLSARKLGFKVLYCGEAAVTHLNLGRNSNRSAIEALRRKWPVAAFPDSHPLDAVNAEIWLRARSKDWRGVAESCRKAAVSDPTPVYPHAYRGFALLKHGRRRAAQHSFQESLSSPASFCPRFTARVLWAVNGSADPNLQFLPEFPTAMYKL